MQKEWPKYFGTLIWFENLFSTSDEKNDEKLECGNFVFGSLCWIAKLDSIFDGLKLLWWKSVDIFWGCSREQLCLLHMDESFAKHSVDGKSSKCLSPFPRAIIYSTVNYFLFICNLLCFNIFNSSSVSF